MHNNIERNGGFFRENRKSIDAAMRSGVAAALLTQKRLGIPAATWKDGRVVLVPAKKIAVRNESVYLHAKHAGNIGDLFKHACLIEFFRSCENEPHPPITYAESHCGFASYPLAGLRGKRRGSWSGERAWSIGPLVSNQWQSAGVQSLRGFIEAAEPHYPGSPELAMRLLPNGTEFIFHDLNVKAIESVEACGQANGIGAFVTANCSDGLDGTRRLLQSNGSREGERLVTFLDPAYRGNRGELADWHSVSEMVKQIRGKCNASLIAWYPKRKSFPSDEWLANLTSYGADWAEVWFAHFDIKLGWCTRDLIGSGLLWVNAPAMQNAVRSVAGSLVAGFSGRSSGKKRLDLEFRESNAVESPSQK
jgi:23S rRNA A2030 N6-methylase RlmJ